ncbi:elongation factor 1-delta [Pimephales promelas]|nr:elongation factor 1-delta [Pimephales promelas]
MVLVYLISVVPSPIFLDDPTPVVPSPVFLVYLSQVVPSPTILEELTPVVPSPMVLEEQTPVVPSPMVLDDPTPVVPNPVFLVYLTPVVPSPTVLEKLTPVVPSPMVLVYLISVLPSLIVLDDPTPVVPSPVFLVCLTSAVPSPMVLEDLKVGGSIPCSPDQMLSESGGEVQLEPLVTFQTLRNITMSGLQGLAQENIWFDKSRYDEAERCFYETKNGVPQTSQERDSSAILQDIAKARQNIQQSLAGVSTAPKMKELIIISTLGINLILEHTEFVL